ncbi:MAG: hypothetical protein CM1200mP29_16720 [Verrucomicrobiota bacterium]|nr:MAG: hypothetical protein CM1200mP29_16720 [Verrucomicrobiota bacterium]
MQRHLCGRLVLRERFVLEPDSPAFAAMKQPFPQGYYASACLSAKPPGRTTVGSGKSMPSSRMMSGLAPVAWSPPAGASSYSLSTAFPSNEPLSNSAKPSQVLSCPGSPGPHLRLCLNLTRLIVLHLFYFSFGPRG